MNTEIYKLQEEIKEKQKLLLSLYEQVGNKTTNDYCHLIGKCFKINTTAYYIYDIVKVKWDKIDCEYVIYMKVIAVNTSPSERILNLYIAQDEETILKNAFSKEGFLTHYNITENIIKSNIQ